MDEQELANLRGAVEALREEAVEEYRTFVPGDEYAVAAVRGALEMNKRVLALIDRSDND